MKKNIWLITGILFACLLVNVKADYIVTPNDEFFRSHEDEIDTWGYWHKSEKDIAIVPYPGSEEIIGVVEEDRVIRVLFLYEDAQGELWGAQGTVDQGLWFKMKYLPKFYANIDFWMEHQEEFNNKRKNQIYYYLL